MTDKPGYKDPIRTPEYPLLLFNEVNDESTRCEQLEEKGHVKPQIRHRIPQ